MSQEIPAWFVDAWKNTAFVVEGIFSVRHQQGYRSRGGARDFWTYVVVTEGTLVLRQGAWRGELVATDQTLLLPNAPFTREVTSDGCRWINIDFRVQATGLGADPLPSLGLPAIVQGALSPAWLALLEESMTAGANGTDAIFDVRGIADRLVSQYLKAGIHSGAIVVTQHTPVPAWLSTVRLQISRLFRSTNANLADIIRESGYSRSHFDRSFKQAFGSTPMEFLWEHRLQMAARKLDTDPQLPINGIARNCGFKSHTHFTRLFRQRFGMTPKQWRRRRVASDG
jgi:AraC-like DNA-binding protein